MEKKIVYIIVISIMLTVGYTNVASAGWTGFKRIAEIEVSDSGANVKIRVKSADGYWDDDDCRAKNATRIDNDPAQDPIISTILAAYLSGKEIQINLGGNCTFTGVTMEN